MSDGAAADPSASTGGGPTDPQPGAGPVDAARPEGFTGAADGRVALAPRERPASPVPMPSDLRSRLDAMFRSDQFAAGLGARLVEWGAGCATVEWAPRPDQVNFAGGVHGGAIFSLADLAFSYACNSWGRACVALSVTIEFLSAPAVAVPLTATATEKSRRRTIAAYDLSVTGPGGLVASCTAMAFRTQGWHFGADAWPGEYRDHY